MDPKDLAFDVITLDSSSIIAALNRADAHHQVAARTLRTLRETLIVPAFILSEVAYMFESRFDHRPLDAFLEALAHGVQQLDCGEGDLPRIRALIQRYANLPLGFADAAVIACAERNGGRVMSFDRRDFMIVAREGTIEIIPQLGA